MVLSSALPPYPPLAMGRRPLEDIISEQLSFLYDVYLEHYPKRALYRSLSYLDDLQYFDLGQIRRVLAVDMRSFHVNQPSRQAIWVSAACLALLILSLPFYNRRRRTIELSDSPRLRAPLNALLDFLTPTTSVWPEDYLKIAEQSLLHSSARLKLPIRSLLRDVLHGTVELRHPAADLPAFILNTHNSHEWSIAPSLEISWHVYVAFQIFRLRLSGLSPLVSLFLSRTQVYTGICAKYEDRNHALLLCRLSLLVSHLLRSPTESPTQASTTKVIPSP